MMKRVLCALVLAAVIGGTGAFASGFGIDASIPVVGGSDPWVDFRFKAGGFDAFVGIRAKGIFEDSMHLILRGGVALQGAEAGNAVFSFPLYVSLDNTDARTGLGFWAGGRIDYAFSERLGVFAQAAVQVVDIPGNKVGKNFFLLDASATEVGVLFRI